MIFKARIGRYRLKSGKLPAWLQKLIYQAAKKFYTKIPDTIIYADDKKIELTVNNQSISSAKVHATIAKFFPDINFQLTMKRRATKK